MAIINSTTELNASGWMHFEAQSNPYAAPSKQMLAIGYAEGVLFHDHIYNHNHNIKDYFLHTYFNDADDYPEDVYAFLRDNLRWLKAKARANIDNEFWQQVYFTVRHFEGLVMGYQSASNQSTFMTELQLYVYMSSGELLDIVNFAVPALRRLLTDRDFAELSDHCSGAVVVTETDAFVGQTAWFTYGSMTRVFKSYQFNLSTARARKVTFSSYPGFSYSFDDWYSTDSGLMFFETTSNVYDPGLYEHCGPETVLTWVRAPVAGRLAEDGEHFSVLVSLYNSGTYNNQWAVVDVRRFDRGSDSGVLWIQEQIPGIQASYDATPQLLRDGFFPSYNIPSIVQLRQIAGYPAMAEEDPTRDYNEAPRAKIFRRDAPKVRNVEEFKSLMRYNDYLNDDLSIGADGVPEPGNAISSRYDLRKDSTKRKCFGGFDAKVGQYTKNSKRIRHCFISSPANEHVGAWKFPSVDDLWCPRRGLPDGPYEYDWVEKEVIL